MTLNHVPSTQWRILLLSLWVTESCFDLMQEKTAKVSKAAVLCLIQHVKMNFTLLLAWWWVLFCCYLSSFFFKNNAVSLEMGPGWVGLLLLAGVCSENLQTHNVSQKCMMDISTFLWELNQDKPKNYAVQSKFWYFWKDISLICSSMQEQH